MPTLAIQSTTNTASELTLSNHRVATVAMRMFRRMPPEQRATRVQHATRRLKQLLKGGFGIENGEVRQNAAIILSQGVTTL